MKWLLCLLGALIAPAQAHDYWLQPEPFQGPVGSPITLHLFVGEGFKFDEERYFQPERTPNLWLVSDQTRRDLRPTLPVTQKAPLGQIVPTEPGTYLVLLDRNASTITLPAQKFKAYLRSEGLTDIVRTRGNTKAPGRERYSRSLKTIIQVGEPISDLPLQPQNQTIELLPLQNPLQAPKTLTVQLRFEGKPQPNRQITARAQGGAAQVRRSNAQGEATFTLDRSGPWIIQTVHMRRCQSNCQKIDWESFWTSLTFSR